MASINVLIDKKENEKGKKLFLRKESINEQYSQQNILGSFTTWDAEYEKNSEINLTNNKKPEPGQDFYIRKNNAKEEEKTARKQELLQNLKKQEEKKKKEKRRRRLIIAILFGILFCCSCPTIFGIAIGLVIGLSSKLSK